MDIEKIEKMFKGFIEMEDKQARDTLVLMLAEIYQAARANGDGATALKVLERLDQLRRSAGMNPSEKAHMVPITGF